MSVQTEKKVHLKPVGFRVVLQRLEEEQTTKGGIIVPDSAKKKQEKAKVVAVGQKKVISEGTSIEIPVKEGDVVLFEKYAGQEVTINEEEFVIVKADDIVAIIEE